MTEPADVTARRTEDMQRRGTLADAEFANLKEMHGHFYTLASASLERSRFAAETIQKASAAIAALYTGVLALVFSVTNNPLPLRGILAPIFLGLAVVLSSMYLTYIVAAPQIDPAWNIKARALEPRAYLRLNTFIRETNNIVSRKIGLLGNALAALLVGLTFIAIPFLGVPAPFAAPPTEAAVQSQMPWPTLDPAGSNLPPQVSAELYKQQVAETAALRVEARKTSPAAESGWYVVVLAVLGLALRFSVNSCRLKKKQIAPSTASNSIQGTTKAVRTPLSPTDNRAPGGRHPTQIGSMICIGLPAAVQMSA